MRVAEKIRYHLTGNPNGHVEYQHTGPNVVRWITQGSNVSVHVLFNEQGDEIAALCPHCKQELGRFRADYGKGTNHQLATICDSANAHYCKQGF